MGNRAIIQTRESYENETLGVYVHWCGGRDMVEAFLKYCELKGYRPPSQDCYGWARLCQVISNYFGGGLSIGIDNFSKEAGKWQDNGTYIIERWKIVDRKYWDPNWDDQGECDMVEALVSIDEAQPVKGQLGEDFLRAKIIPVRELKVGDVVWFDNFGYKKHTVVGFGKAQYLNGHYVYGLPYVDLYERDGDYSWNINNYIFDRTIRVDK